MQGRASTMPHSSAVKQLRAEVCRSLARPGGISASSYGSRNLTDMPALCGGDRKRKKRGIRPLRSPRVTAPIFRGHILFGVPIIVRTEVLSSDMPSSAETYQILLRSSKQHLMRGAFFIRFRGGIAKRDPFAIPIARPCSYSQARRPCVLTPLSARPWSACGWLGARRGKSVYEP